jgi:di/tricarboxylate transporter
MFKRERLIGLCIALAVGLIVWFSPTPTSLSLEGQKSLAIFLTALLLILTRPIPGGPAVLATLVAAALLGVTGGKKYRCGRVRRFLLLGVLDYNLRFRNHDSNRSQRVGAANSLYADLENRGGAA